MWGVHTRLHVFSCIPMVTYVHACGVRMPMFCDLHIDFVSMINDVRCMFRVVCSDSWFVFQSTRYPFMFYV